MIAILIAQLLIFIVCASISAQDTLPPVGKIDINKDSKVVYSRNVTLTIHASDVNGVAQMCINEVPSGDCMGWIPYQQNIAVTLSPGNGIKTVCVRVMDNAGKVGSPSCDYIRLLE